MQIIKNKKGDANFLLVGLIVALAIGGILIYKYIESEGLLFTPTSEIDEVKDRCSSLCYSLETNDYCHSTFNVNYQINTKNKIVLKDTTCYFLSNLQDKNLLKIPECKSIKCNDLILENNVNEYERQRACETSFSKEEYVNRVYSLNNQSSQKYYTLEYTKCFKESELECSNSIPSFPSVNININSLNEGDPRKKVAQTMGLCVNSRSLGDNCWETVNSIYSKAGVSFSCVYTDNPEKKYSVADYKTSTSLPFLISTSNCEKYGLNEESKLNLLKIGDIISYIYDKKTGHNAIFVAWSDRNKKEAWLFDWNGGNDHFYRYYKEIISDNKHPVYMIWKPVNKFEKVSA